ncbi:MAG: lipopolysaccharide biosynthesis protein [Actinomycetota bacterium]|nr:lipopolysaccharide biosynthesis protein [Actinomycetota bacterium]
MANEAPAEDLLHVKSAVPPGILAPGTEAVGPGVDPAITFGHSTRSFRANSAARFLSDAYLLLTSLVAATVTARLLGPSGKGFFSTLTLLSVLLVQVFNFGLGEAAVVLVGRRQAQLRTATRATAMALIPLSVIGAAGFLGFGWAVLDPATPNERTAIVLGTVLLLSQVWSTAVVWFLVLQERIVLVAVLTSCSATVATAALWWLVAEGDYGIAGAVAGGLAGALVILGAVLTYVVRAGMSLSPRWHTDYLRRAIRFGVAVQMSNLLVQMTGRLDLVLVYRLADSSAAGNYSIALTIGALVGAVPIALAFASFPRLAQLDDAQATDFTRQLFRMGIAAAIASAAVLAVMTPFVLPLLFGRAYTASITPTMLLVGAGIFWSGQWLLSRAAAARGEPKALFLSFALSFVVMIGLDFVLIGRFDGTGAAVASSIGSALGFVVSAAYYRGWGWRGFIPGRRDFADAVSTGRAMFGRLFAWRRTTG